MDSLVFSAQNYTDEYSDRDILSMLRPCVAEWFKRNFSSFTLPQRMSIPLIKKGYNVLISSPTGSGKTLAAFLAIIDELVSIAESNALEDKVYAVYVSPLRALNNDMKKNLMEPLEGIKQIYKELTGSDLNDIRVAVRTGDTPPSERQSMLKKPPHILITTPESLALILVSPKFRWKLSDVKWIIIDEIHELASSKRGTMLSIMIERLEWFVKKPLQRIGLSATISPLESIAEFLGGYNDDGVPRPVMIVDARFYKKSDIRVLTPNISLVYAGSDELNESIYKLLAELIRIHRTTLVFTNTRSSTEKVVYKLKKLLEKKGVANLDEVEAHHGSLSRNLRLDVENRLKGGRLKCVVCSTSLELGIDIGYIDLVVLLSSPKSVSRLLQRIGRAGHKITEVSKGRIIVVNRDDLVECAVLSWAARNRIIDRSKIPLKPLDVLAQQIIAMSLEQKWNVMDAYRLIKRSYPYKELSIEEFKQVLSFLGGLEHSLEEFRVYSKLWYDPIEETFGKKKGIRHIYYLNQGVIPDEAKIHVFSKSKKYIGDLEEEFVQFLVPGDIFILGGKTYKFIESHGSYIVVENAEGQRPTVPAWFSEMLPLSFDSAILIGGFRRAITELIEKGYGESFIIDWIKRELLLDDRAAMEIYNYIYEQYKFTGGIVASDRLIHIEIYDDQKARNIIFHSLFGRRTNDALSRAYGTVLSNLVVRPIRITVSDNAFMLTIPGHPDVDVRELLQRVTRENLRELVTDALWNTELLKRRFRYTAQRSFMILKNYKGRERSPHKLQLNAQAILEAIRMSSDNPVVKETIREILEDHMDIENAERVLELVKEGWIEIKITPPWDIPSPFAHHIVATGFQDIVLMEDKKRLLIELYNQVMRRIHQLQNTGSKNE